jgi:phospholipid-translocating ATPase
MTRIHFAEEGSDVENGTGHRIQQETSHVSKPGPKRSRWATTRLQGQSGVKKRLSILNRIPKVHINAEEKPGDESQTGFKISSESPMGQEKVDVKSEFRKIYTNQPLPPDEIDENGHKKHEFPRNKIRTAKYTALSFIPKNLWFQFHNVANIYFLFVIILGVGSSPLGNS